jgi:hypothetical protein
MACKIFSKIKKWLLEPDEYDGVRWLDVIISCAITSAFMSLIAFLIRLCC